jgi:hypothetical protein
MLPVDLPQAGSNDILYARISGVNAAGPEDRYPAVCLEARPDRCAALCIRGPMAFPEDVPGRVGPLAQLARAHA